MCLCLFVHCCLLDPISLPCRDEIIWHTRTRDKLSGMQTRRKSRTRRKRLGLCVVSCNHWSKKHPSLWTIFCDVCSAKQLSPFRGSVLDSVSSEKNRCFWIIIIILLHVHVSRSARKSLVSDRYASLWLCMGRTLQVILLLYARGFFLFPGSF